MTNTLQLVKNYHLAIWDEKDLAAIDRFFDVGAVIHSPMQQSQGPEQMKAVIAKWYRAFPDLVVHFDDYICQDDKVVARWHAEGTQQGEFLGQAASNKSVRYSGVTTYQISNDKIAAYWALVDMDAIKQQLAI